MKVPEIPTPKDMSVEQKKSEAARLIWDRELTAYVKKVARRQENMNKAYMLIFGQCSEGIRAKLSSMNNYEEIEETYDLVGLLKGIQAVMYSYQGQQHRSHAVIEAQRRLYSLRQDNMSCQEYLDRFKIMVSVVEHCGGEIGYSLKELEVREKAGGDILKIKTELREQYLATMFLLGSDRSRYGRMLDELENQYSQQQDSYPDTIVEA